MEFQLPGMEMALLCRSAFWILTVLADDILLDSTLEMPKSPILTTFFFLHNMIF